MSRWTWRAEEGKLPEGEKINLHYLSTQILSNAFEKRVRKASGKKDSTVLKKILADRKVLHLKNGGKVEKYDGRRRK